jgi:hypothetical protein
MIARILGAIATGEGEVKAERWKRSWRQGREAGVPAKTGSRLFGYTRDGVLIPDEAEIVRGMATDILEGAAILGVARRLEAAGVVGTRGALWTPVAIKQYLTNPRIAGWSTLNGDIVAEGDWEPIIDRDTWEGLRALLAARTRPYVGRVSLLNGLLFCSACGTRMITGNQRGKRTYRCPARPGKNLNGCGKIGGNAEPIEEIVEAFAQVRLEDPAVRARVEVLRAEPGQHQHEVSELEMRIKELEAQLDEPGIPVATILRAIDRAKDRQADLLAAVAALPRVELPPKGGAWPEDLRRRRALVDLVVARVELLPVTMRGRAWFDPERVVVEPR